MYDIYMYLKASMPGMKNGLLKEYQKTGQHHARAGGGIPGDESHMIEVVSPRAQ